MPLYPGQKLPLALETVALELSKLPSIGRKSGLRLALHLLKVAPEQVQALSEALSVLRTKVGLCQRCGFLAEGELCAICTDPQRNHGTICVVEEPGDVLAIERSRGHRGSYHVLHGRLSPLAGILPQDLNLASLIGRVRSGEPCPAEELIIATNPTADGDATALYIQQTLQNLPVKLTRLALGMPNNSAVESADETTLGRALLGRQDLRAQ